MDEARLARLRASFGELEGTFFEFDESAQELLKTFERLPEVTTEEPE